MRHRFADRKWHNLSALNQKRNFFTMKIESKDTAFLLIGKIDTYERLENALAVAEYLCSILETNIYFWEIGRTPNNILPRLLPESIFYSFHESVDPILHRTKVINEMVEQIDCKFFSVWDIDVIVPEEQIAQALDSLNKGADFAYPYTDYFLDTTEALRQEYLQKRNIDTLKQYAKFMVRLYKPHPVGGAFFAKKSAYIECGLENEGFYGWGMEDGERIARWMGHRKKIAKVDGMLFHLSHPRGVNSEYQDPSDRTNKQRIYLKTIREQAWIH